MLYLLLVEFLEMDDLMNYIILDLEWNQADDLKTKLANKLTFEIIEIGAVKLNSNKEQIDCFHEMIKPQVFNRMNQITGEIIHISIKELENCPSFKEAAEKFMHWCGNDYIFCTWGNLDLSELQKNMDFYNMMPLSEKPFKYYDVQKLFSIAFEDKKKRSTLQYAVEFLGIKEDVPFHRADADAFYTAAVLKEAAKVKGVLGNYSFDTYHLPKNRAEEIKASFEDYSKYISREFPNKSFAMSDRNVVSTRCFICGARTSNKIPWFSKNGRNYYAVMECPKHGNIKGKIRMKKSSFDKVYVVKTMKQADMKTVDDIADKRAQLREIRREKRHKV